MIQIINFTTIIIINIHYEINKLKLNKLSEEKVL